MIIVNQDRKDIVSWMLQIQNTHIVKTHTTEQFA
jgi:hypothetical protein